MGRVKWALLLVPGFVIQYELGDPWFWLHVATLVAWWLVEPVLDARRLGLRRRELRVGADRVEIAVRLRQLAE